MLWRIIGLSLSNGSGVLQAPSFEGPPFDFLPVQQDGPPAPEVDVGRREVFQALMVAPIIVMTDKVADRRFKIALQEVVFQEDAVLGRLVPAFDLALRLRMAWRAANVLHVLLRKPVSEIAGDVR